MMWKVLTAVLAIIAVSLAVPALRHLREVPPPPPPVIHAQLAVPPGVTVGSGASALEAAISPDQRAVVFVATRDGRTGLWMESLADSTARPLTGTDGASMPSWTRDGRVIFFATGKLNVLDTSTGEVTAAADAPAPGGAAGLADGAILFVGTASGVVQRLSRGVLSAQTQLAPGDAAHQFPFVDEAGRLLYIAVRESGVRVVRLLTEEGVVDLTETAGHAELHGGILLHVRDEVLLAQHLDPTSRRLIGRSTALATGVGRSERGHAFFTASPRIGLWSAGVAAKSELAWFDVSGTPAGTAAEPGDYWQVRLAPNGRDVAVTMLDPLLRTLDVAVFPQSAPGTARRVSLGIGPDTDPVWSPDSSTLLYRSAQSGPGEMFERPAATSPRPEEVVLRKRVDLTPSDWRGQTVLFHAPGETGTRSILALDRAQGRETPVTGTGFNSWNARWSVDGRWIAYTSDEGGQPEVYVQAWPSGMPRVRATFGGGQRPQWSRDGRLYFLRGGSVMRTNLTGGSPPIVATPQAVFTRAGLRDFALTPNGDRILAIVPAPGSAAPEAQAIIDWPSAVPPPAPPIIR